MRRLLERAERLELEAEARELDLAANLDAQHARILQPDSTISGLEETIASLEQEIEGLRALPPEPAAPAAETAHQPETEPLGEGALRALASRPDIARMPVLVEAQYAELVARRGRMPQSLNPAPLLHGDVDAMLADAGWNPSGRDLTLEERAQLALLLKDYRFYGRVAPQERVTKVILPLVESMREEGAYIEYPSDSPPPRIQGKTITHSEPGDDQRFKRLYVFYEEDYPDLHHAQTVEYQRELETVVQSYELINKP